MWKKDEASEARPETPRPEATPPRNEPTRSRAPVGETATIGSSITIRGEVTGDEDLLIQGRIDGSVDLKQHAVTVGPEGQVKAGISGRIVTVEGTVEGDLQAQEQVILRSTARVEGDITAPRVVLEDGASFRGGVDMGESVEEGAARSGSGAGSSPPAVRDRQAVSSKTGAGASGPDSSSKDSSRESSKESSRKTAGETTGAAT